MELDRHSMLRYRQSLFSFTQFYEFLRRLQPNIEMDETKFIYDKVVKIGHSENAVSFADVEVLLKDSGINPSAFLAGKINPLRKA